MIYISEKEFETLSNLDGNYKGAYGSCYKYNGNVLKVFKHDISVSSFNIISNNIDDLVNYKIDNVAFPIEKVLIDKKYPGYIMPFIEGNTITDSIDKIKNGLLDISFNDFSLAYKDVIDKCYMLADNYIFIDDLNMDNLIIDKDKTGIIDCDFYRIRKDLDYDFIFNNNIEHAKNRFEDFINSFVDPYYFSFVIYKNNETYVDDMLDNIISKNKDANSFLELIIK